MPIFFHRTAATGRIDDDWRLARHGFDEVRSKFPGFVELAVVRVKCPAAAVLGRLDLVPNSVEQSLGTLMNAREENLHRAALEHIDLTLHVCFW